MPDFAWSVEFLEGECTLVLRWPFRTHVVATAEEPGATRRAAPSQLSDQDWAPFRAWEDRVKAVEEAQELSASQLHAYALGAVPSTPLPAQEDQDSLEEDLLVLPTSVEREREREAKWCITR